MKILVTGANGFLGTSLVERLLQHGETDLRCTVRPGRDTTALLDLAAGYPDARLELFVGDLRSPGFAVRALDGVGTVYHLAAAMRGSPADLVGNTVVSSRNLLDALIRTGLPRVILVSSLAVYAAGDLPRRAVIDETTALEQYPEKRDHYSFAKILQERLFWEYHNNHGVPMVVFRPGVIYGPGGVRLSTRIGLRIFGVFFNFGRDNVLPLTYVDNCAEAIVSAGGQTAGQVYNVVDDDLPTASMFLHMYRHHIERLRYITIPYSVTKVMSRLIERYHQSSKGQLPAVLTTYKSSNLWKGHNFDNSRLKHAGWRQVVSTQEGLKRYLAYWMEHKDDGKTR